MCGICGMINRKKCKESTVDTVREMMKVQHHRGPDDSGLAGIRFNGERACPIDENGRDNGKYDAVLGFNRLSIRDLSVNGHQPMFSEDGMTAIVFNGEIYNADEYRDLLKTKGYYFKSSTDTEVILNLYREIGIEKTLSSLNGMFAIGIFDIRQRKAFFARDRFGIKPLYYLETGDIFAFASELKSLIEIPDWKRDISMMALEEHLLYRGTEPTTLFEQVRQLLPGELLIYSADENVIERKQFFDINSFKRKTSKELSYSRAKQMMEECIQRCVDRQVVSDVKVGCQLSGGVDSSLVTYYASKNNGLKDSVSITFDTKELSEKPYIDKAAETCDIDAHEYLLQDEWVIKNFERGVWHMDVMAQHPNSYGILYLSERARECVTVLLSGEGADELMGGYAPYCMRKLVGIYTWNPLLKALAKRTGISKKFFKTNNVSPLEYISEAELLVQPKKLGSFVNASMEDADKIVSRRRAIVDAFEGSYFDKQVKYEMCTYLPELLVRQDKMSMANSIENRVPILDNEFVECTFTMPEKYLLRFTGNAERFPRKLWEGKYMFKEICADKFGKNFAYRQKMGFPIQVKAILSHDRMKQYIYETIWGGMKQRGYLKTEHFVTMYEKIDYLTSAELEVLWKAISFEVWCQLFVDKRAYRVV